MDKLINAMKYNEDDDYIDGEDLDEDEGFYDEEGDAEEPAPRSTARAAAAEEYEEETPAPAPRARARAAAPADTDARVINMARDLLVDEEAVVRAIEEGKVRRYVSDFPNPTVAGKPGCITTPHLGASTEESEINCAKMAVDEMRDFLENGNIRNSVNYPNCDLGICKTGGRIAVFHANKANMITQFTRVMGDAGVNISGMANQSRGEYAYTLLDIDNAASQEVIDGLREATGVYRVRVVK